MKRAAGPEKDEAKMNIVKEWENFAYCWKCGHKLCEKCCRMASSVEKQLEEHEEEAVIFGIPNRPIPKELLGKSAICCECGSGDCLAGGWIGPRGTPGWLKHDEEHEVRRPLREVQMESIAAESEKERGLNERGFSGIRGWVYVSPREKK